MYEKSSINFLMVDKPKNNLLEKIIYSFFFIKELFLEKKSNKDYFFSINKDDLTKFWGDKNSWIINSPSRIACDAYLIKYLKENFNQKKINILDLGCGKGKYSKMIQNLGYEINYLGADSIKRDIWEKFENTNINFIQTSFGNNNEEQLKLIKSKIKNVNLILSQSCLEHIKYDISALKEVNSLFPNAQHLHFVPAVNSFFNYFTHGYRRYTYSSLKNLSHLFNKEINIMPLGNNYTLRQYFSWFYSLKKKKHNYDYLNYYKEDYLINEKLEKIVFSKKKQYPIFYCLNLK